MKLLKVFLKIEVSSFSLDAYPADVSSTEVSPYPASVSKMLL